MPTYSELNDPLEGQVLNFILPGYAGISMHFAADEEDMFVKESKEKYRILSFSSVHNSPQLWAHYANNYEGVCLCFSAEESFNCYQPIGYYNERIDRHMKPKERLDAAVKTSFFKKNIEWSYERELRIVKKGVKKKYLKFDKTELLAVIFGHNLPEKTSDLLASHLDNSVLKFKTHVGHRSFNINILDYDYKYPWDGSDLKTVDLERKLLKIREP